MTTGPFDPSLQDPFSQFLWEIEPLVADIPPDEVDILWFLDKVSSARGPRESRENAELCERDNRLRERSNEDPFTYLGLFLQEPEMRGTRRVASGAFLFFIYSLHHLGTLVRLTILLPPETLRRKTLRQEPLAWSLSRWGWRHVYMLERFHHILHGGDVEASLRLLPLREQVLQLASAFGRNVPTILTELAAQVLSRAYRFHKADQVFRLLTGKVRKRLDINPVFLASERWKGMCPKLRHLTLSALDTKKAMAEFELEEDITKNPKSGESRFDSILAFAREELKGKERRILELVCDAGGTCKLANIATDSRIQWDQPFDGPWNSTRVRLNRKMKAQGLPWRLDRIDNEARLIPLSTRK